MATEQEPTGELSLGEEVAARIQTSLKTLADIAAEKRDIREADDDLQQEMAVLLGNFVMSHTGSFESLLGASKPDDLLDIIDARASNQLQHALLEEYAAQYVRREATELGQLMEGRSITASSKNGYGFAKVDASGITTDPEDPQIVTGTFVDLDLEAGAILLASAEDGTVREIYVFSYYEAEESYQQARVVQQATLEIAEQ